MMLEYFPEPNAFFASEFDPDALRGCARIDVEIDGGAFAVFEYSGEGIPSVINEAGEPVCRGDVAFVRVGANGELVGLDGLGCLQVAMHRASYDRHEAVIVKERRRKE